MRVRLISRTRWPNHTCLRRACGVAKPHMPAPRVRGGLSPNRAGRLVPKGCIAERRQWRRLCGFGQDAGDDFGGEDVAAEGGADLDALDQGADGFEHLLGDEDAFAFGGVGGIGLGHAQHDLLGHGDAQVVFHELGVAQAGEGPDAGDDGDAELGDALEEALEEAEVEDGLGDGVLRAGLDLVAEAAEFVLDVGHAGVGGDADGEVGAGADGVGADVEPVVEAADDVDETDGVDVKDSSSVRIIAQLGRVAGEAQDVVQSDGRGPQQVRLNGQNIAIAAGVMENGLNPGVLLDLDAEALRAHAGRGAGRVGDVDGVDAEAGEEACALDLLDAVDALGRDNFDQGDKGALLDERADEGALRRAEPAAFPC